MQINHLRVAIIGAGGFLGTNLARFLHPLVAELRCYGHPPAFPEAHVGVKWITGDMTDAALMDAISGCDVVVHLAGASNPAISNNNILLDAEEGLLGSLKLFESCLQAGVGRVILASSGGTVYGIPQHVPLGEDSPTLPITAYGVSKLATEKYLEVYRCQRGLEYRVLRLSNPYGPYQTAARQQGVIAAFLRQALSGRAIEIWGDGSVVRDYIYVDDVCAAIAASLTHEGAARVFNIGSGKGLSLNQVAEAVEAMLGHPLERRYMPGRPVDVPVNVLDCSLAEQELGWGPETKFSAGLKRTLQWLDASRQFA